MPPLPASGAAAEPVGRRDFVKRHRPARLAALLLALLALLTPRGIETTHYLCVSPALPEAFDGFRIVELADLHGAVLGAAQPQLLDAVRGAAPERIAITGDLFDAQTDRAALEPLLRALLTAAPVFYVTGNHEWAAGGVPETLSRLRSLGVTVVDNGWRVLRRGDAQIVVAGVQDPNGFRDADPPEALLSAVRQQCGEDCYILLLAHRNGQLARWYRCRVQTVLAGHGHGGVLRLPLVGGLLGTDGTLLPFFDAGLYRAGDTTMVVSRGLGSTGVLPRLGNRPELPVIVLRKRCANDLRRGVGHEAAPEGGGGASRAACES